MTNRAQAKPTKAPKDVIEQQSMLTPLMISAFLVVVSVVWMGYDDFIATKPWKAYQDHYQRVAVSFLAEELYDVANGAQRRFNEKSGAFLDARGALEAERVKERLAAIDADIDRQLKALEVQLDAIEGSVADQYWLKEQRSILTEARYQREHGHGMDVTTYRGMLAEADRRGEMVTRLKLLETQLRNRGPQVHAAAAEIARRLDALTADVRAVRATLGSFADYKKDYVQRFRFNGGPNDIVDRCESCHTGADKPYLDRNRMWASHLANDAVREFLTAKKYREKDYWRHNVERLERIAMLAEMNGDFSSSTSFFTNKPTGDDNELLGWKELSGLLAVKNFDDIESLFSSGVEGAFAPLDDAAWAEIKAAWNAKQLWRTNPMLRAPETEEEEKEVSEDTGGAEAGGGEAAVPSASSPLFMGDETLARLAEKHELDAGVEYDSDREMEAQEVPEMFLTAEVFIYLASHGPFAIQGLPAYPDRFGIGSRHWFRAVVSDPRVHEVYKVAFKDFSHSIKEQLLMYTGHPRRDDLLGNHPPEVFGCMSCHRGFGINAKSVESAHGYQHHWLTPLFKDGYLDAGCQKCHKAEIEIAHSRRVQQGKDLYQQLGCWGCHAYEGYEAEAGRKLTVGKELKDIVLAVESLGMDIAKAEQAYEAGFKGAGFSNLKKSLEAQGYDSTQADAIRNRMRSEAESKLQADKRMLSGLEAGRIELLKRMDELDVEHKKRGPTLKDLAVKVGEANKGWVANWIRYPKGWRPSTKMPHFFYGPFAFVDEDVVIAAGGERAEAFEPEKEGNPLYRRLKKDSVDALKKIAAHVWQASRAARDLGDSAPPSLHGIDPANTKAVDQGRLLFTSRGCMGCHGFEPDLVKRNVAMPKLGNAERAGEDYHPVAEYQSAEEWAPAPKYVYRTDGTIQRDGHGNAVKNEFIYSFAANLSRVGEKAEADYLLEWILQPRVRNKHGIMPSFWPALAGTPPGMEREALDAAITGLEAKSKVDASLGVRVELADAKRRRGDIAPDNIRFYGAVRDEIDAAPTKSERMLEVARLLGEALIGYEQAKYVAAFLTSLKHEELASKGLNEPLNGYVGDYTYHSNEFVSEKAAGEASETAAESDDPFEEGISDADKARRKKPLIEGERARLGLSDAPTGDFKSVEVEVKGFGDYTFMDTDYDLYLRARKVQRAAAALAPSADAIVADAARTVGLSGSALANLARDIGRFRDRLGASMAQVRALERVALTFARDSDAQGLSELEARLRQTELAALEASIAANADAAKRLAALADVTLPLEGALDPRLGADVAARFTEIADILRQHRLTAIDFERNTYAGDGKRFTAFYGCAGCHEIEGLESEGKIGTELTEEGSKFIQRLDFGMLEFHGTADDPHAPSSPPWVTRASLTPDDPAYRALGDYRTQVPEHLPFLRGGRGMELPHGMRRRYIQSKYDMRIRDAWFRGKLHHPRQWDKGRLLSHEDGWFERLRMPLFEFNEDDLIAITNFIEGSENMEPWGAGGLALPESYIYNHDGAKSDKTEGWWIVKKYNCIGCHSVGPYEGRLRRLAGIDYGAFVKAHLTPESAQASPVKLTDDIKNTPPVLFDTGARVRGEWLVSWLRNPYEVRNMDYSTNAGSLLRIYGEEALYEAQAGGSVAAKVIMPKFYLTDAESRALQKFLTNMAKVPEVYVGKATASPPEAIAFGEKIFQAINCLSCHGVLEESAGYLTPGGTAPNLRGVAARVRRDWVRSWLRNTDAIQPLGRMPEYFRYDSAEDRWVLKESADGNDHIRPHTNPGDKTSPLVEYDGDHIEALIAWLYEGLPRRTPAELDDILRAAGHERK